MTESLKQHLLNCLLLILFDLFDMKKYNLNFLIFHQNVCLTAYSVTGGRFPRARLRANTMLVRKTLSHDVTFLVFLPFRDTSRYKWIFRACCSRRSLPPFTPHAFRILLFSSRTYFSIEPKFYFRIDALLFWVKHVEI